MKDRNVPTLPNKKEAIKILEKAGCHENVIRHCKAVAKFAAVIAKKLQEHGVEIDEDLVMSGALLHDIGRSCSQEIDHAVQGARIAKELDMDPRIVNIIERHIGAGICADEAKALGLPCKDYIPETIEEKVVCHADNMVNFKRHNVEKTIEKLERKGQQRAADMMRKLHKELSDLAGKDLNDL